MTRRRVSSLFSRLQKSNLTAAKALAELGGVTLCSDGITSEANRPIINLVSVGGGVVEFILAKDCSGVIKDGEFLSKEIIIPAIMALSAPFNVVQVNMDNATRSAWPHIEAACPWIVCAPCWPHCLDLLLEDIGKLQFFKCLFKEVHRVRKFLRNKGMALYVLRRHAATAIANPGATRFRTNLIVLASMLKVKEAVVATLTSSDLRDYVAKNKSQRGTVREGEEEDAQTLGDKFKELQSLVLNDEFWERCELVKAVMMPIGKLQALTDSNSATASKVHFHMFLVVQAIEAIDFGTDEGMVELKENILYLANKRWTYATSDITLVGYLLDPEFWDCDNLEECSDAFFRQVDRTFPLPETPKAPASEEALAAWSAARESVLAKRAKAESQLADYKNRSIGIFNRESAITAAKNESAYDWWYLYGSLTPELRRVALRVCAQPCGAGSSERAHKDLSAVVTKKRTRMGWDKAEEAIYIRMNRRRLNTTRDLDYSVAVIPDAGGYEDDSEVDDTPDDVETAEAAAERVRAARAAAVQAAAAAVGSAQSVAYAVEAATNDVEPDGAPDAWAEARVEPPSNSSASAALPADVSAHTARRVRCVAAAQKRVKPAPETVAATAEEKERREGRKVRRPARFDD